MSVTYIINYTDPGKSSFSIPAYKTDGPISPVSGTLDANALSAHTSLLLYGKGSPNYGERIQENLINMLEHFSGPTAPVYPTRGQIWHDTTAGMLKMYSGTSWLSLDAVLSGTSAPSSPTSGQLWYDTSIPQLKIYNGSSFVSVADRYLALGGGTLTGALILNADPSVALGAATKQYVDAAVSGGGAALTTHIADTTVHLTSLQNTLLDGLSATLTYTHLNFVEGVTSNIQTQLDAKVAKAGDTMSGVLDMGSNKITNLANATAAADALNLQTADAAYVKLSGSTMTGFLTLSAAPINNLHAATKKYVDDSIAAIPPGGGGSDGVLNGATYDSLTYTLTLTTSPPASGTFNVPLLHGHPYRVFDTADPGHLRAFFNNLPVLAVTTGVGGDFTVSGDFTTAFFPGETFDIQNSTGNDGTYTVDSSSYDSGFDETTVVVVENVPNVTADGEVFFSSPPLVSMQQLGDALEQQKAPVFSPTLLEQTQLTVERNIIAVVTGAGGSFKIEGDWTSLFVAGFVFDVGDSTGNDGEYTTASSSLSSGDTIIVVTGSVPDSTVDGEVIWPHQPSTQYDATPKSYVDNKTTISRTIQTGSATTTPSYIVGSNNLWIFVNGVKWYLGDGYTEVGTAGDASTTISWVSPPSGSDRVEFLVFGV